MSEASDDEAKELFAYFGLAIYCSCVLEHGIANALMVIEYLEGRGGAKSRIEWERLVDQHYEDTFAKTLGRLIRQLERHRDRLPTLVLIKEELENCLAERNHLVHHFWREQAEGWLSADGRAAMVRRLVAARDMFSMTDRKLEEAVRPLAVRQGITPDLIEQEMRRIGAHGD